MRAQIQSQVIVYILAVFIMAMVLLFGYQAIQDIMRSMAMAQLATFRDDLSKSITTNAGMHGSSKVLSIDTPSQFNKICFVNLEFPDVIWQLRDIKEPLINDSVSSALNQTVSFARRNVFLCPPCTDQMFVGRLELADKDGNDVAYLCLRPSQGRLRFVVEGLGDGARISVPQ